MGLPLSSRVATRIYKIGLAGLIISMPAAHYIIPDLIMRHEWYEESLRMILSRKMLDVLPQLNIPTCGKLLEDAAQPVILRFESELRYHISGIGRAYDEARQKKHERLVPKADLDMG
ncbi:hypothetical protein HYX05_01895 [Candidatus Woesearchaeota archaeon]|nr:hypothetical protein [Candidatus Woesearchaeota archaeon]